MTHQSGAGGVPPVGSAPPAPDPATLAMLSESEDRDERRAALEHAHLPLSSIVKFVTGEQLSHPYRNSDPVAFHWIADVDAFSRNPSLDGVILRQVLESAFFRRRDAVVPYPDVEHWEELAHAYDPRCDVLWTVLAHRCCPPELLTWAVSSGDLDARLGAAAHPDLSEDQVRELLSTRALERDGSPGIGAPVGSEEWETLSETLSRKMVELVIDSGSVSAGFLFGLLPVLSAPHRRALAQYLSGAELEECVRIVLEIDDSATACFWGASRVTDANWIRILSTHSRSVVRERVAKNASTDASVLAVLCRDGSPRVRNTAAKHPNTSELDRTFVALLDPEAKF